MFDIDLVNDYKSIEDLAADVKDCRSCSLREQSDQVTYYDGDVCSPVMIVGMNPGTIEDFTGIPLSGRNEVLRSRCVSCESYSNCYNWQTGQGAARPLRNSCSGYIPKDTENDIPSKTSVGAYYIGGLRTAGQVFDDCMEALGIDRNKLFITNSALCKSTCGDPKPEHINTCSKILTATTSLVSPKVVIPLGSLAATGFISTNKSSFSASRGKPLDSNDTAGLKIVANYHPSYILRMMISDTTGSNAAKIREVKWEFFTNFTVAFKLLSDEELTPLVGDWERVKKWR